MNERMNLHYIFSQGSFQNVDVMWKCRDASLPNTTGSAGLFTDVYSYYEGWPVRGRVQRGEET